MKLFSQGCDGYRELAGVDRRQKAKETYCPERQVLLSVWPML